MTSQAAAQGDTGRPAPAATRKRQRSLIDRWRDSKLIRPRLISLMHLLSGSFGSALVMMASLSIAARSLGTEAFGVMVVVLSIGRVCERLIRFETWQPLIRFVAQEEEAGATPERLSRLYAYGLVLDLCSASCAAVLAIGVAWMLGGVFGLGPGHVDLVATYALAIAVNVRGASSAALRLNGRFRTLAYVQLVASLVRLVLAGLLLFGGGGLAGFVIVWTAAQILDCMLFNFFGLRTLSQAGIPSPWRAKWRGLPGQFPGFMRFALSTNLSSMLRTLTHETDTLLVSAFAGPGGAGLYYIARRVAKVAQTAGDMIQTVVYPDLARIWARVGHQSMRRLLMVLQSALGAIALAMIAVAWLVGEQILEVSFGPGFAAAWPMLLAQLFAVLMILHAAPSRSALLAMNRPTYVLATASLSTAVFFTCAVILMPRYGALGANFAHIAFGLTTALLLDSGVWRGLARARRNEGHNGDVAP